MRQVNYFYLPNAIITNTNLCYSDFAVVAYLYSLYGAYGHDTLLGACIKVKQVTIAQSCGISVDSVSRAVKRLMDSGIIIGKQRTVREDRTLGTYIYTLQPFKREEHKHTLINKKAAGKLQPKELKVYSLFCMCRENFKNSFFHSYNDLAKLLKMKRREVSEIVGKLIGHGLIRKQLRKTKCGDYTENKYFIVTFICGRFVKRTKKIVTVVVSVSHYLMIAQIKSFKKPIKTNILLYDST